MPTRTRYREVDPTFHNSGEAKALQVGLSDHHQSPTYWPRLRENMVDTTGNFSTTNPLEFHQDDWVLGWVTGQNSNSWECSKWGVRVDWGYLPSGLDDRNDDVLGTKALAITNPSRPNLNVWNFLFELKDIPMMVKSCFRLMKKYGPQSKYNKWPKGILLPSIAGDASDIYLSWVFGWEMLISDIGKMLDIYAGVTARMKDLSDLSSGDLRKTATLSETYAYDGRTVYWGPLYNANSQLQISLECYRKIWARVRYKPTAATFAYTGQDQYALARSLVFGHNVNLDTLYNALPWSWMIDWYSSVGDYISATQNQLGVQVDDVAIMRHSTMKAKGVTFASNPHNAVFEPNPAYGWSRKARVRWTGSPVIQAYVPILQHKQLGILAALGTKYLRGK